MATIPYQKTYELVGWTYEADEHCLDCAAERFRDVPDGQQWIDREGNRAHGIFAGDWYDAEYPSHCGDCGAALRD